MKLILLALLLSSCASSKSDAWQECDFRESELAIEACKAMITYKRDVLHKGDH